METAKLNHDQHTKKAFQAHELSTKTSCQATTTPPSAAMNTANQWQKQNEQLKEVNKNQDDFIGNMIAVNDATATTTNAANVTNNIHKSSSSAKEAVEQVLQKSTVPQQSITSSPQMQSKSELEMIDRNQKDFNLETTINDLNKLNESDITDAKVYFKDEKVIVNKNFEDNEDEVDDSEDDCLYIGATHFIDLMSDNENEKHVNEPRTKRNPNNINSSPQEIEQNDVPNNATEQAEIIEASTLLESKEFEAKNVIREIELEENARRDHYTKTEKQQKLTLGKNQPPMASLIEELFDKDPPEQLPKPNLDDIPKTPRNLDRTDNERTTNDNPSGSSSSSDSSESSSSVSSSTASSTDNEDEEENNGNGNNSNMEEGEIRDTDDGISDDKSETEQLQNSAKNLPIVKKPKLC